MPTIGGIIDAYRRELIRRESAITRQLLREWAFVWSRLEAELQVIDRQIADAIARGEIDDAARWTHRQTWWRQVQGSLDAELARFNGTALSMIEAGQYDAVGLSQRATNQIARMITVDTPFRGRVNPAAMERWVSARQPGSPLRGVFDRYDAGIRDAMERGITEGIGRRQGVGSIVRGIRKEIGPGGVTDGKLATIIRTEVMRASRGSSRDSLEALGPNVIEGWEWRAAKSRNTCAACLAYDGRRFPYKQYPDRFHISCRCVVAPVINKELLPEMPERETGAAWLARQDEKTKRRVLGTKDRYALYQDGVPLRDFIGVRRNRTWGSSLYVKPAGKVRTPPSMGQAVFPSPDLPLIEQMQYDYDTWDTMFSEDEKRAVLAYKGSEYEVINRELRSGEALSSETKRRVELIDRQIRSFHVSQESTVYRGISVPADHQLLKLKPGDTTSDPAYLSASVDKITARNYAYDFSGENTSVVMDIVVDPGQPYLPMDRGGKYESEVLFERDAEIVVGATSYDDRGRFVISGRMRRKS